VAVGYGDSGVVYEESEDGDLILRSTGQRNVDFP